MNYPYLVAIFILTLKELYFDIFLYLVIFFILFAVVFYLYYWYYDIDIYDELLLTDLIIENDNNKFNFYKKLILPEDSDKDSENDYSISLSDIKYIKEKTEIKDKFEKNIKIIYLKEILGKDNIENINDLIKIANFYEEKYLNVYTNFNKKLYQYNDDYFTINLEKVYKIKKPLIKLKKMVGLETIKNDIIDLILHYLITFEVNNTMLHMTLEGPPGCGKTKLAKIISQLLNKIEILSSDKIVYAKSTDLIAEYVGQTGAKTQKVINSALGGVLFIDEAYAIGSTNGREHNFGAECINVLNQNLSDNKNKFICIIAGYPDELDEMFFSFNPGLKRRFPFKFTITGYTFQELMKIFIQKVYKLDLKIDCDIDVESFFKENYKEFKFFGGDIDTFLQNIKYANSRRTICNLKEKVITIEDFNKGFEKLKNSRKENINIKNKNKNKKIYNLIKKLI
jgi:SpoVK/Ycf46/Vps4 family AAA+-type ATPase